MPSVKVLGRWAYRWTAAPGVPRWTEPEKKFYHSLSQISQVVPATKTIYLDSADVLDYYVCNPAMKCGITNAIPHEFLHTLGALDEAQAGSPHLHDARSIMNIGKQLRNRHLQRVVHVLNEMVPDARFSLAA